jgi:outer membrane protein TolC
MVSADATLSAIEKQSQLLQTLSDIATKRVEAGTAPDVERLQATLAKKQSDSFLFQAKSAFIQAKIHLNALLGNQLPETFSINKPDFFIPGAYQADPDLLPAINKPLPATNTLIEAAFQHRADLKAALTQQTVGKNELRLAQAQKIPDLQLGVGGIFLGGPFLGVSATYSPTGKKEFFSGMYTSLTFELPVFNQYKGDIAKAQAEITQAEFMERYKEMAERGLPIPPASPTAELSDSAIYAAQVQGAMYAVGTIAAVATIGGLLWVSYKK